MIKFKVTAGILVGFGLIGAGMLLEGGHSSSFLQLTSFLMVLGPVTGFTLMTYPMSLVTMGIKSVFTEFTPTPEECRKIYDAFNNLGRIAILAAFISSILGMVHALSNLDKPENIGPGISVAFISQVYGFGFKLFIAMPIEAAARGKMHINQAEDRHEHRSSTNTISRAA